MWLYKLEMISNCFVWLLWETQASAKPHQQVCLVWCQIAAESRDATLPLCPSKSIAGRFSARLLSLNYSFILFHFLLHCYFCFLLLQAFNFYVKSNCATTSSWKVWEARSFTSGYAHSFIPYTGVIQPRTLVQRPFFRATVNQYYSYIYYNCLCLSTVVINSIIYIFVLGYITWRLIHFRKDAATGAANVTSPAQQDNIPK